jgi:hypothetical protein
MHATLDTDELDRVEPAPPLPELVAITERNLKAMWSTFADAGHTKLILVGVFVDLPRHIAWFGRIVGTTDVRAVRLLASDTALTERVRRREIGSGGDAQLERTLGYAAAIRAQDHDPSILLLETDGRAPADIGAEIVRFSGWASG